MTHNPLLDAALRYADNGWHVFPLHGIERGGCSCLSPRCKDEGKHPRTVNGLKSATTDRDQIRRWWEMWPNSNIGIRTGTESGIWVLDIDNKKTAQVGLAQIGLGDASIQEYERETGKTLPETLAVQTGSGGVHYYYELPPDVPLRNREGVRPAVDVRGVGGYVVSPPSIHLSGHPYRWIDADLEPAPTPQWLVDFVLSVRAEQASRDFGSPFAEGTRNSSLHDLGSEYRRKYGFGKEELFGLLMAHNIHRCIPPLDSEEVGRIAGNVASYGTDVAVDADEWAADIAKMKAEKAPPEIPEGGDLALSLEQLFADPPTPPPALLYGPTGKPIMYAGTGIIVAGPPNVGKTWIMMDLLLAVATGGKWLGTYQAEQGTVLFVDEEGHPYGDYERFKMLLDGRDYLPPDGIPLRLAMGTGIRLDSEVGVTRLRRMVERYAPRLVVLDSLVRFNSGDENDARSMANFFAITKQIMQAYGTAFCFTHHVRKPSLMDSDDVGNIIRGTSEIRAWPDGIWVATAGEDSQQALLHNIKQRWGKREDNVMQVRIQIDDDDETARLGIEGVVEPGDRHRSPAANQNKILKAIHDLEEARLYPTLDAIAERCDRNPRTIRDHLNQMVSANVIESVVGAAMFGQPKSMKTIYRVR